MFDNEEHTCGLSSLKSFKGQACHISLLSLINPLISYLALQWGEDYNSTVL